MRLIGRSSVPGAVFVLVVAAAFVFGLPLVAAELGDDDAPVAPSQQALTVGPDSGDTVTLTVAGDWVVEAQTDASVTLTNAGAVLSIVAPQAVAATGAPEIVIDRAVDDLARDVDSAWVSSEPIEITTTAGDPGLCVTGSTLTDIAMTCAVQHDDLVSTMTAESATQVWPSLQTGVDAMIASMTFTGSAA